MGGGGWGEKGRVGGAGGSLVMKEAGGRCGGGSGGGVWGGGGGRERKRGKGERGDVRYIGWFSPPGQKLPSTSLLHMDINSQSFTTQMGSLIRPQPA